MPFKLEGGGGEDFPFLTRSLQELKEPGRLFIGDSSCQDDFACSGASGTIGS